MSQRFRGFFGSPSRELAALHDAVRAANAPDPFGDFTIEATWGPRPATPRRIAECLVLTARRLQGLDERLELVFRDRHYVCSSGSEPVLDCARDHSLERMVRRVSGASRDGIAESPVPPPPLLGAGVSLRAYLADARGACLSIRAGHHVAPDADNGVRISLDVAHFLLPDKPLVVDLLAVLIDVWQPDMAGLHGNATPPNASRLWWLAWKRDDFDPHSAALRRAWPGALPDGGQAWLGGRLWEWAAHAPAARLAVLNGR